MTSYSKDEVLKTAEIDPEFAPIWNKISSHFKPMSGEISTVRAEFAARKAELIKNMPTAESLGVSEENISFKGRDGHDIPVRIHKPLKANGPLPLVVIYHGGGFCIGDLDSETVLCRSLAAKLQVVCVNVEYRLAPEAPFPAATSDAYDGLVWAAENAQRLGADPTLGFIVGGNSAGGNLADVTAHTARDAGFTPPITGQVLMVPALVSEELLSGEYKDMYLSSSQNSEAPILPRQTVEWFMSHYKPDYKSTLFAPFSDPKEHAGMPPAYIVAAGMDPLRDDAILYHYALKKAGVMTQLKIYPGLPHSFWSFFSMLSSSQRFVSETLAGVKWLLNGAK